MASEKVVAVEEGSWERDVLGADAPVLVDFWADWCPPCRKLAPTVDALAQEYDGRVRVAKLDVDKSPAVAERYGVMSIPTLILFQGGQVVEQRIGAVPAAEIRAMLDAQLAAAPRA